MNNRSKDVPGTGYNHNFPCKLGSEVFIIVDLSFSKDKPLKGRVVGYSISNNGYGNYVHIIVPKEELRDDSLFGMHCEENISSLNLDWFLSEEAALQFIELKKKSKENSNGIL